MPEGVHGKLQVGIFTLEVPVPGVALVHHLPGVDPGRGVAAQGEGREAVLGSTVGYELEGVGVLGGGGAGAGSVVSVGGVRWRKNGL